MADNLVCAHIYSCGKLIKSTEEAEVSNCMGYVLSICEI